MEKFTRTYLQEASVYDWNNWFSKQLAFGVGTRSSPQKMYVAVDTCVWITASLMPSNAGQELGFCFVGYFSLLNVEYLLKENQLDYWVFLVSMYKQHGLVYLPAWSTLINCGVSSFSIDHKHRWGQRQALFCSPLNHQHSSWHIVGGLLVIFRKHGCWKRNKGIWNLYDD